MPLRALYVDFNSYFASAEQQLDPRLRGRPVAVLPVLADTTCCIAASHEAKRRGVRTGTLVAEARKLCPDIRFVEARPAVYVDLHHHLVEAIESCLHVDRVMSIDEVACRLTGSDRQRSRALALADRIKRAIAERVGAELRSSIGIAPNIFLAKLASDMQKPDGCVVIEDADLPDCLYGLALRDLCGIGKAMEQRLHRAGIRTVRDLCGTSREGLHRAWGSIEGERLYGHSHVLPPELRTPQAAHSILHRLLQKAAMRLRSYACVAGAMHLRVAFRDKRSWARQARFEPTSDTLQLLEAMENLWREFAADGSQPYAVAITLSRLEERQHHARSLFDEGHKHDKLNAIIDSLNLRYGRNTLYFGGAHAALHAAPMRIAFGHIPDLEVEGDD